MFPVRNLNGEPPRISRGGLDWDRPESFIPFRILRVGTNLVLVRVINIFPGLAELENSPVPWRRQRQDLGVLEDVSFS